MISLVRKRRRRKYLGFVLYAGPSLLDGQPIVVVATLKTRNGKTGRMIQTWIMRADVSPTVAINTGQDASVCGDCPLRGLIRDGRNVARGCYVQVRNAPFQIWRAWRAGRYPHYSPAAHAELFLGKLLRIGSYGDPAAVPLGVWQSLLSLSRAHTGYTHQWRRFPELSSFCMASVDSHADAIEAQAASWRTFRTLPRLAVLGAGEILCPASDEAGKRRQCETCLACRGGAPPRVSVAIVAHGSPATLSSYRKSVREN